MRSDESEHAAADTERAETTKLAETLQVERLEDEAAEPVEHQLPAGESPFEQKPFDGNNAGFTEAQPGDQEVRAFIASLRNEETFLDDLSSNTIPTANHEPDSRTKGSTEKYVTPEGFPTNTSSSSSEEDIAAITKVLFDDAQTVEQTLDEILGETADKAEAEILGIPTVIKLEESTGRRRQRAGWIQTVCENDNVLKACDNVRVECVAFAEEPLLRLRRTDMWKDYVESDHSVVVAVEATHISELDVSIRRGFLNEYLDTPFCLGTNFVGIVHKGCMPQGTRVAAITKSGANARYITTTPDCLVKVPKRFDSSEVACVLSTYLPAFQALHHGAKGGRKHSMESLKGKNVLLTSGASIVEIHAMVQLALALGASKVFVICKARFHNYVKLQLGVKPLGQYADDWLPHVKGQMDLVIDYDYSRNKADVGEARAPGGRLVWFAHPPRDEPTLTRDMRNFFDQASICTLPNACIYDVYQNWEFHREESQEDLKFLFALLASRKIRPKIDRYIDLNGVRSAHQDLQKRSIAGAIICEPWKEHVS
jgi:NADPH:quinone reductase-like Zn-dependent oxidoreductase